MDGLRNGENIGKEPGPPPEIVGATENLRAIVIKCGNDYLTIPLRHGKTEPL